MQASEVDVGTVVPLVPDHPLRRHVARCADGQARPAQRGSAERARDAEVHQVGEAPFGRAPGGADEQHIGRLHVAVDEAFGVGGVERVRDLRHDVDGPRRREQTDADHGGEVDAMNEPHVDEKLAVDLAEVVDGDDVRFAQLGRQRRLAAEAHPVLGVGGELPGQAFERHDPVAPGVEGPKDLPHATAADELLQAVRAEELRPPGGQHPGSPTPALPTPPQASSRFCLRAAERCGPSSAATTPPTVWASAARPSPSIGAAPDPSQTTSLFPPGHSRACTSSGTNAPRAATASASSASRHRPGRVSVGASATRTGRSGAPPVHTAVALSSSGRYAVRNPASQAVGSAASTERSTTIASGAEVMISAVHRDTQSPHSGAGLAAIWARVVVRAASGVGAVVGSRPQPGSDLSTTV